MCVLSLAQGPQRKAIFCYGYNTSGFRFHTKQHDESRKTQNYGVMVRSDDQSVIVPYYVVLKEIVELSYAEGNKVVLFNCDTFREKIGYKRDRHGRVILNMSRKLNTQEPFVLASQALQIYYVRGIKDPTWGTAIETKPRNLFPWMKEIHIKKKRFNILMCLPL